MSTSPLSAQSKVGRRFKLEVQQAFGAVSTFGFPFTETGLSPLTLDFDINRQTLSDANTGKFTIRNLNENSRGNIYFDPQISWGLHKGLSLWLGYASDNSLTKVFQGNVSSAYSKKQPPDWITEIEGFDGIHDRQNSHASYSSAQITADIKDILSQVIHQGGKPMSHTSIGEVSNLRLNTGGLRGLTIFEPTWSYLQQLARANQYNVFIDKEKLHFISEEDMKKFNADRPKLISSKTGLLGTPRKYGHRMEVDLIMSPEFDIMDQCTVESAEKVCNGSGWQVQGIRHHGRISFTAGGEVRTTLTLINSDPDVEEPVQAGESSNNVSNIA